MSKGHHIMHKQIHLIFIIYLFQIQKEVLIIFCDQFYCSAVKRRIIKWAVPLHKTFSTQALIFCFLQKLGIECEAKVCNAGFYMCACFVAVVSICVFFFFLLCGLFKVTSWSCLFQFSILLVENSTLSLNAYCSQVQYYFSFRKSHVFFGSSFSRTR